MRQHQKLGRFTDKKRLIRLQHELAWAIAGEEKDFDGLSRKVRDDAFGKETVRSQSCLGMGGTHALLALRKIDEENIGEFSIHLTVLAQMHRR